MLRLLKASDEAGDDGTGLVGEWSEFERIVPHVVAVLPGCEYGCRATAAPTRGPRTIPLALPTLADVRLIAPGGRWGRAATPDPSTTGRRRTLRSDDHPTEAASDEPDTQQVAAEPGQQTLDKKSIKGQVIIYTIVKPLPGGQTEA
ncbi:hypothetical protein ABZY81_38480 [Streptomyces sp. NPDC006514]|uniref:hypothetical protein n=1 Tax=Streptomyces sp. NPDC006514 TaxID=3154308 RepID=UPI0033B2A225